MYADDACISFSSNSISTINNVVNEDLESLKTWLEENKSPLNVARAHCILIGSKNKIRALKQSNTTMLSIYIGDDKVSPITNTITKIVPRGSGIGMLSVTSHWKLYKWCTEVSLSHTLGTAVQLGGNASSTNLKRFQKLQIRAARIVADSPYDAHSEPRIKELGWLTIKQLVDAETV